MNNIECYMCEKPNPSRRVMLDFLGYRKTVLVCQPCWEKIK